MSRNNKNKDNITMPQIVAAPAAASEGTPLAASDKGSRAPRVAVDMDRITFLDVPSECKIVLIDGIRIGAIYKSEAGTVTRCNDRASMQPMTGILEFHPTEKDKDGYFVVTLDKLTAWVTAAIRKAWGKTEKPFSNAILEFIAFRVAQGDSQEVAEKKARAL